MYMSDARCSKIQGCKNIVICNIVTVSCKISAVIVIAIAQEYAQAAPAVVALGDLPLFELCLAW